jgi:Uncharacterized protein conserved in bacteria (DUF2252)
MTESLSVAASAAPAAQHDLAATAAERGVAGKAARKRARRGALGCWDESERRQDALQTILARAPSVFPELLPIRRRRMVASAWNYYRGAAAVMAADLAG